MPEIIHDEPHSIIETHIGRPRLKVRHQLEAIVAQAKGLPEDISDDSCIEAIDAILDAIHEQMTFRSGWGAVVIQRIKRGEDL
jgi:hypothetical protein